MKKIPVGVLTILLLGTLACNKEVESVPLPPFTVFPNPFIEDFAVHLDNVLPSQSQMQLRILDGKEQVIAVWEDPVPGSSIHVSMVDREKAIYYAELTVGNEVFLQPILKAK